MKSMDYHELYKDALHYDAKNANIKADIPFFARLIEKFGDPVLELACGTGRMTIPFAKNSTDITGIDISQPMLDYAGKKAADAGLKINLINGDIRNFHLNKKFNFIFIPFNSILHLHDIKSYEQCFKCVSEHLSSDGRFAVDVFQPRLDILMRDPEAKIEIEGYDDPHGYGKILMQEKTAYDSAKQLINITWFYRYPDGTEKEVCFALRILFPQELDALLNFCGFEIDEKYGDYDFSLFGSDSPKQLIICRKK